MNNSNLLGCRCPPLAVADYGESSIVIDREDPVIVVAFPI